MNGGWQVKEILNLIIVKSSQSTDRLFYKVDRHKGKVNKWLCLFYFLPLPKYAIGFLKYQNKNRQTFKRFADDLLTVY